MGHRGNGARGGVGAQPGAVSCKVPPWILGHGVGITKALSLEGVFSIQERRRQRLT